MAGYTKNIAVIRAVRSGFSSNGGEISGLVKAEKYGNFLRAEAVKINFAPLSAGRYVTGISDGVRVAICRGDKFEGNSDMDIAFGFAALVCFVREGEVSPVATAVCGDYSWALPRIQSEIERREGAVGAVVYEDDAIAEDNYYEYGDGAQSGGAVREDTQQEAEPRERKDEDDFGICEGQEAGKAPIELLREGGEYGGRAGDVTAEDGAFAPQYAAGSDIESAEAGLAAGEVAFHGIKNAQGEDRNNGLGEGGGKDFYARMHAEIERLLCDYPREEKLEQTVQGSRWVRINYGSGRYYVFGVIYQGGTPAYVCYGVPSKNSAKPPQSLAGMASYIPAGRHGYWVMYQNAQTGESVKMRAE